MSLTSRDSMLSQAPSAYQQRQWTGYMCFVVYNRPQLRKDHPELSPKDILKVAGQKWNTLTQEEKTLWGNEASHANSNRVNINDNMKTPWEGGVRSSQMYKASRKQT